LKTDTETCRSYGTPKLCNSSNLSSLHFYCGNIK